jgi:hypothetical protein
MDWTKSCRTLERDLESKKHPGSRIKVIREAKNRVGDSRGKFGQNDFCKILAEKGVLDGSDKDRRNYKQFENGARAYRADQEPIPTVLSLLEITPGFAGFSEEPGLKKDASGSASRGAKTGKVKGKSNGTSAPKAITLKVHNYLEEPLTILALHKDGELELFIQHGDQRVPNEFFEDRLGPEVSLKELWIRDKVVKFACSKEDRSEIPGRIKAVLS